MSVTAIRPPGVYAEMLTRPAPVVTAGAASGQFLVVGLFAQGRTDAPTLCRSLAEVISAYGERPNPSYSAAWDELEAFFMHGGGQARVLRVVGPAATSGTLVLKDGSAKDTLRVEALGAGAWSAGVTVEVVAGSLAGTVKVIVRFGDVVEVYDNAVSPADLARKMTVSRYVRALDLGSTTAAPGNLPAMAAAAALSSGADDRAAVVAATMTAALPLLDAGLGTGAVAIPGYSADVVGSALIAHAKANQRVAILSAPVGTAPSSALTLAQGLLGADGGCGTIAYPWVRTPVYGAPGVSQLTSGVGYVAAMRSRAHTASGPWGQAAGTPAISSWIMDVERSLTDAERASLNAAGVSAIRRMTGGVRLYGYSSLALDRANYGSLSDQDSMNYLYQRGVDALEAFVFAPLTKSVLGQAKGALIGICEDIRKAGGALERYTDGDRPQLIDPGYAVEVTTDPNQPNTLVASVALRLPGHAEFVHLTLTRVATAATLA